MNFKDFEQIGPEAAKGKYFRFLRSYQTMNLVPGKTGIILIPSGSIGYCYAATMGSVFLGLGKDFKQPPGKLTMPTNYPVAIQISLHETFTLLHMEA